MRFKARNRFFYQVPFFVNQKQRMPVNDKWLNDRREGLGGEAGIGTFGP